MNLSSHRETRLDINLTPLIDVVFLLLIFFMVSTTFDRESALEVELPEASREATDEPEEALEIVIDAQGNYYINENRVVNNRPETLRAALAQVAGDDRSRPVVLKADARTPHQSVITVMDSVGRLGFDRLTFGTRQGTP